MFGKFFNKKEENQQNEKEIELPSNPTVLPFEFLVLTYLQNNGIDESGKFIGTKAELTAKDIEWIELSQKAAGLYESPFLEDLVIEEWKQMKELNNNLNPVEFSKEFVENYHNTKMEQYLPDDVIERNKNILAAYSNLIITIERIQGWLNEDELRTRIESNFIKKKGVKSTISQCTTPFCAISLGCDGMGRYNLVYSIDYRFKEMISEDFASTLIRRIYEFTPGEMEPFVRIGSLCQDCVQLFNQLIEESKSEGYHTLVKKEKHEI
jgi:bacterioferritin-associated ferredoxin